TLDVTAAPREVHVVDELPRRGIGKVDRRALAERLRPPPPQARAGGHPQAR
ncbi:MAG: hypothetical protein WBB07_12205, partial [Mycobacterium sp.]